VKRHSCRASWYDITQDLDPSGQRVVRYYAITCRDCGRSLKVQPGAMSNEAVRKLFLRLKWELGRKPRSHLCPDCQPTGRPCSPPQPPPPPPPPPAKNPVYAAWHEADDQQRYEFFGELLNTESKVVWFEAWLVSNGFAFTRHSSVAEQAQPAGNGQATEQAEDRPADDHDEPADWWLELHGKEQEEHHGSD
jgi:hypothetical protein